MLRVPVRYCPVSGLAPARDTGPAKTTCPPCSPLAGPELDHVVGGANGLEVVLDDDDGVAGVAQSRQEHEQTVRRRAGAGRWTARRARTAYRRGASRASSRARCAGLRRRRACARAGRARGSRVRRRTRKWRACGRFARARGRRPVARSRRERESVEPGAELVHRQRGSPARCRVRRCGRAAPRAGGACRDTRDTSCAVWYWRRKTRMYCL